MNQEKFLQYVQAENKVEPKDVMPDDYRKLDTVFIYTRLQKL